MIPSAPIRVAHVVWRLSVAGGIPRVVRDLATSLDPASVEICVVSVRPRYSEDHLDEVIEASRFRSANHPIDARRLRLVLAAVRLTRHLRSLQPDVIHLHSGTSWLGLPAALSLRAHRILEMHDEPQSSRSGRLNVAIMKLSARRLGFRVLVHSTVVRDRTAEAFGIPAEAISLIPLGIDADLFRPDAELRASGRGRLGIQHLQPVVLWVGRLEPLKRPHDALAVARAVLAAHPEAVFVLAGSGSEQERLTSAAADDPRIRVLGYVDDLPELLNSADVFLSTSGYEGFGLSIAEAMACALPVVSTRAGGVVDLVSEGLTGHLVPVGAIEAMAKRVDQLIVDARGARAMGDAGRRIAMNTLTRSAMAEAYRTEYQRLVSMPCHPP